jgi:SAM-dependent methyltransferase
MRPSFLDVGSYDVNGNLKTAIEAVFGKDNFFYVGLDQESGPNVDVVVKPTKAKEKPSPWPLSSNYFDFVLSSSALEHDKFFWLTFLEMLRLAKHGGLIYLNLPSRQDIHRFPVDCWRFFFDAGESLADWGTINGINTTLLTAFTHVNESVIIPDRGDTVLIFYKHRNVPEIDDPNIIGFRYLFNQLQANVLLSMNNISDIRLVNSLLPFNLKACHENSCSLLATLTIENISEIQYNY